MKNLFLYEKIFPEEGSKISENGVYFFKNCTLVGIDPDVISKTIRQIYVAQIRCREFFILQEWIIEFIKNVEVLEVDISSIKYNISLDDDVKDAESQLIKSKDFKKLADLLEQTMHYYEYEITDIDFVYKSNMFSIKSNGVLTIFDDNSVNNILDSKFMCVLQGFYRGVI